MSSFRPAIRWSASICGLVLVTSLTATTMPASASGATVPATTGTSAHRSAATRVVGTPPRNYAPYAGPRFAYLKRGRAQQALIRSQVLATINSTWGGPLDSHGLPLATNGKIRIATWSFGDKPIAKALVAARNRGVSVQVMGAAAINKTHPEWGWLKKRLGSRAYRAGVPDAYTRSSFARACKGSCRGRGGTQHAKFFLFSNVGPSHASNVVYQTSMNLTSFAWHGQWNSAQVTINPQVYAEFNAIFVQMLPTTYVNSPFRDWVPNRAPYEDIFFPLTLSPGAVDPVLRMLNATGCTASGLSDGKTHIRILQYAIYQSRGEAIAKRLRQLWNAGCDIKIIYAVTTRPVLNILRNNSGRGPIPMKQSIIRGSDGTIAKYNHSKWMTIAGNYNHQGAQFRTIAGSANWANLAMSSDEQMQIINGYANLLAYNANFNTTWNQRTSGKPTLAYIDDGRVLPLPENDIPWGKGIYKHMQED